VERGYPIIDRDLEAGFILFEFPVTADRTGRGSIELVATRDAADRPSVNASVRTDSGPMHLPHTLLHGLFAKLRSERGQPAPPPPAPKPVPPKDDERAPGGDSSAPQEPGPDGSP
jgi:hypothetical protein